MNTVQPLPVDLMEARPGAALAVRRAARSGGFDGQTSGLAPGHVQCNLVILPPDAAADFRLFCERNPKPCPLLAMSEPGSRRFPHLGADLDTATDLPRYRIWRDGVVAAEPTDLASIWRDDWVAFALGCSFSFEEALRGEDLPVRHVELGCNVPMYRTNIPCVPAGRFAGPLVVSMRPFAPENVHRAVAITSRFPSVHGAPVHIGAPEEIGIGDLEKPDYGEAVPVAAHEVPLFWACGVTPQAAIAAAKLPFAVTHAPGCMLVTDLFNADLDA